MLVQGSKDEAEKVGIIYRGRVVVPNILWTKSFLWLFISQNKTSKNLFKSLHLNKSIKFTVIVLQI
jgi:hypothetical protein